VERSRAYAQGMVHFSQFDNKYLYGGPVTVFASTVNAGEVHQYWQQYGPDASGQWHSNVDVTRIINTPTGHLAYGWVGYSQQFLGEVKYLSSDMPGGASFSSAFNLLRVQSAANTWQYIPSPSCQGPTKTRAGGP
jgi:hypothetical protein